MSPGTTGRAAPRRFVAFALSAITISASLMVQAESAPTFTRIAMPGGGCCYEPQIGISPDGRIFVNAPNGLPSHSKAWRSDDGGATFKELTFPSPYNRFFGGGDSAMAFSPGGRTYFIDLSGVSNSLTVDDDGHGDSWDFATPLTTLHADRQWISVGNRDAEGNDTVYVIYHLLAPGHLAFARSRDSGRTFTWHTLAPLVPPVLSIPSPLVTEGDYLGFTYPNGGKTYYTWSEDAGDTWHAPSEIGIFTGVANNITSVSRDPVTKILYTTYATTNGRNVYVARSKDNGLTWTTIPVNLARGNTSNVFPSVAARDGKVAVTWFGGDGGSYSPDDAPASFTWKLRYAELDDTGISDEDWSSAVNWEIVDIAAAGTVKKGMICTAGVTCTGGRELGDFTSIEIAPDGRSLISYFDNAGLSTDPGPSPKTGAQAVIQVL